MKETLRKIDPKQSVLRARDDLARIDSFERAWLEERRALELEAEKLRETLKSAEEQTKRDVAIIAALEERLKDSVATEPNSLNDLDGEDLNDELNTSRKSLYVYNKGWLIKDVFKLHGLREKLQPLKQKQSSTDWPPIKSQPFYHVLSNGLVVRPT